MTPDRVVRVHRHGGVDEAAAEQAGGTIGSVTTHRNSFDAFRRRHKEHRGGATADAPLPVARSGAPAIRLHRHCGATTMGPTERNRMNVLDAGIAEAGIAEAGIAEAGIAEDGRSTWNA